MKLPRSADGVSDLDGATVVQRTMSVRYTVSPQVFSTIGVEAFHTVQVKLEGYLEEARVR